MPSASDPSIRSAIPSINYRAQIPSSSASVTRQLMRIFLAPVSNAALTRMYMTSSTRSVAVIGAGPAGLVAAKTLLSHTSTAFRVTIFEQHDKVGGMWALSQDTQDTQDTEAANETLEGAWQPRCSPQMLTNLSRFTVAFSDLGWDKTELGLESHPAPMFPPAWQVGRYADAYARKYIPPGVIRLQNRVEQVEKLASDTVPKWRLRWRSFADGSTDEETFDYIVVASGFFSSPRPLELPLPSTAGTDKNVIPCMHSSRVRNVTDLLTDSSPATSGTIVVIGGSISGVEVASMLALQLSDSEWSAAPKHRKSGDFTITHITKRPAYVLPRYLRHPLTPHPAFIPVDLALYELGRRPPGPIKFGLGLTSAERASQTHTFLSEATGGDKLANGSEELQHTDKDRAEAPYVAISDSYSGLVREKLIKPIRGTAVAIETQAGSTSITVERIGPDGQTETLHVPNVAAIVYATGFSPRPSVHYFPQEVREQLDADWGCERIPFILHDTISHPSNPSLAFVGFYDGPFWSVMEMQARMIADRWAGEEVTNSGAAAGGGQKGADSEGMDAISELQALWSLRAGIKRKDLSVPQYTLGDYVGLLEKFATALEIKRKKLDYAESDRIGPLVAARFTTPDVAGDKEQVEAVLRDLSETIVQATKSTRFLGAATINALAGPWKLERSLSSRLPEFPSGTFVGTACFHPRLPTAPGYSQELLYIEDGTLITLQGYEMKATRRYVYRYSAEKDELTAWFVKEDAKTVDYLFHKVDFPVRSSDSTGNSTSGRSIRANAFHHCSPDDYTANYEFEFQGAALKSFTISYDVKGPRKDYITNARYWRD